MQTVMNGPPDIRNRCALQLCAVCHCRFVDEIIQVLAGSSYHTLKQVKTMKFEDVAWPEGDATVGGKKGFVRGVIRKLKEAEKEPAPGAVTHVTVRGCGVVPLRWFLQVMWESQVAIIFPPLLGSVALLLFTR